MCTLMGKPSTFMSSLETTNICTLMGNPDFCTMISICTLIGKHQHLYCHGKPLVCVLLRGTMLAQGMLHRVYQFSSLITLEKLNSAFSPFLFVFAKNHFYCPQMSPKVFQSLTSEHAQSISAQCILPVSNPVCIYYNHTCC